MELEMMKDFEHYGSVPTELIKKYEGKVPAKLIEIWKNYGFGTFANGYVKIINPEDYTEILEHSYFAADTSIPIFATGFADVIHWSKNKYLKIIQYKRHDISSYSFGLESFVSNFGNERTMKFLDNAQYDSAVQLLGSLDYDECFGYVPLLPLGGSEKVERLQKMKIIQHIKLITDMAGRIE